MDDGGWLWEIEPGDRERMCRSASLVLTSAAGIELQPRCPVCARPPGVIFEVALEASFRGNVRRLAVPFCAPCAEGVLRRFHLVARGVLANQVVLFAAMAPSSAAVRPLAGGSSPDPLALQAARLAPLPFVPLALCWIRLAFRERWFVGVRITGADPGGTRVDLAIDDPAYAAVLARLDPEPVSEAR